MIAPMLFLAGLVDRDKKPLASVYRVPLDGDGQAECDGDCDDGDPLTYDGAAEQCDGLDNDCDGAVDEGVAAARRASAPCLISSSHHALTRGSSI